MVYFKTNWIQDSNRWVIRKIRPITYFAVAFGIYFHFTLYEHTGRRVAFFNKYIDWRTEEEKQNFANSKRSRWGYTPRYEPSSTRSIKARKYKQQSLEETLKDVPRNENSNLKGGVYNTFYKVEEPENCRKLYFFELEHSRKPGTFDYTKPQTYHSLFPDVEQDSYVTIGGKDHRKLAISKYSQ